ncbi:MAG: cobalamin-dependent protein, partial [Candidatus Omnitrophica bacterium]|nr:cobalamin-dependent protein [Candidatus Omnitrophota bacterium]
MKVLLIDPPGWQKHSLSLGLAYLAGALQAANLDVLILDLNNHTYSDERINKIIIDYRPEVIGISVKTATANVSAQIVRRLKNIFPKIIYVAGGPHITLCAKEFIQEHKEIDLAISGEGEEALVKLIKNIQDGKKDISKISGISYRKDDNAVFSNTYENLDISKLNFPVFDCVKDMVFTDFRYPLLTSRGCPYGCIFGCVGLISGKKCRAG